MSYNCAIGIKASQVCTAIGIALVILLFSYQSRAQSLGDPIVNITFGSGSAIRSGALAADSGSTTNIYSSSGFPNDNYYTIANTTAGMLSGWWTTTDHTGNTGGYMMIVNGSYTPGIFYTRTVTGLCSNTKYQFAAWLKNLLNYSGILPNVTFSIETTTGTVLGSGNTGDIPTANTWRQFPFTFSTPANTGTVVIKMTNNAPGGVGNDIAIDDITFSPYGPLVTAQFASAATTQSTCAGVSQTLTINTTTTVSAGYVQKVQEYLNGVWTDQTAADSVSAFNVTTPTAAGTYLYRIVSGLAANISSARCIVASNQLTLTVQPSPVPAFTVADSTCLGTATVFTDNSTSTGAAITNWAWDFGDGQTSSAQNPSHTYTASGNYTVNLVVTNSRGCMSTATPKTIHISTLPVAAFAYTTPGCATTAITFTDQSSPGEGTLSTWLWDYGDGTTETKTTKAAFVHTYATAATYTVRLTVTNTRGCSASISKSIIISPLPVVNFGMPDVCLTDASALFTDSTTIADNSSLTYLWNFGDANATVANPNISTLKNPSHKYTQAAVYQVSLTVTTANGCTANITKSFTVNGATPVANFTVLNPTTLCSNREVFFTNQSTVDFGKITKIEWYYDYGNNPTVVVTDNSPYSGKLYRHTYTEFHTSATQNYQVRMAAYSGGTCVSIMDKTITLLATPQLAFTPQAALCQDAAPVQLTATEVSGPTGGGVFSGTGVTGTGLFTPSIAGTGSIPVTYVYTSANSCADTVMQNITVNAMPTVSAGADQSILQGASITLKATAKGDSLTYAWLPATGLSNARVLNPVATPNTTTIYTLTVTNSKGCTASARVTVTVLLAPVVPNSFTPNSDGTNDTWVIKYLDTYTDCTVDVFNRYGQKVFSSVGYAAPWDGKYNNKDLPVGVYYYLINPKHGRGAMSGSLTILR